MALLTCPACGSPASDRESTCSSCHATLHTGAFDPGMVVAAQPIDRADHAEHAEPGPAATMEGAAEIEHEHREVSATTLLQSDRSLDESASGADETPTDPVDAAPVEEATAPPPASVPGTEIDPHPAARTRRPPALVWRLRVLVAAAVLLIGVIALLALRPGQHMQPVAAKQPRPTSTATTASTPTLTATPASTPTPQPMPGYTWYVDGTTGYMVQYPTTWTKTSDSNLTTQFADGNLSDTGTYVLQVSHPDPSTLGVPAQGDSSSIAAQWVDFELNALQQKIVDGQTFQRVPGPIPTATIGGQSWQSGIATVDQVYPNGQTVPIRVQVFATVHNGRPYIINVLASADAFATGEHQYFTPILNTFQFLPTSAQGS